MTENAKYILNFTPTGLIPTREMTPNVPVEPDEIVEQTLEAAELRANMVHLHARDAETGKPNCSKEVYSEIISGIRKKNKDMVICVSTSGRFFSEYEKRSEVLNLNGKLKPDMASLTLSSLNFNKQASINSPDMIKRLANKMLENNIKPELEVFDLGMINYAKYLIRKGLLFEPFYFNLILGNIACAQADLMSLGLMIRELPANSVWSVGAVGDSQLSMNMISLAAGGGVRVGLEDNIWYDKERTQLATNRGLVERIVDIGRSMGKQPYRPIEVRHLLNIN